MEFVARSAKFLFALLLAFISVAVALLVVLVLTVNLIDWNKRQDLLISLVERFSDWQVEELGEVRLGLWFPIELAVDELALSQHSPQSSLASVEAEHFEVSIAPLSIFFSDRLGIRHLEARGARVVVDEPPEEPPEDTGPTAIPHIETARIRDSEVEFWVEGLEKDLLLQITHFDIDSPTENEDLVIDGEGNLEGLAVDLSGDVGDLGNLGVGADRLPFDLEGSIAGDSFALRGEIDSIEELVGDLQLAVTGDSLPQIAQALGFQFGDIPAYEVSAALSSSGERFDVSDLRAELGESSVRGNIDLQLDGDKPALRASLTSPLLREEDLLSLVPEQTGFDESSANEPTRFEFLDALNADVNFELAEYQGELLGPVSAFALDATVEAGSLSARGDIEVIGERVAVDAQAGPAEDQPERSTLPFAIALSLAGDTLRSEGQISSTGDDWLYAARVAAQGDNLTEVAQAMGTSLGETPDYSLQLAVDGSTEQANVKELYVSLGESVLEGEISLSLDQPRPQLQAELLSPLLREQDLAGLFAGNNQQSNDQQSQQTAAATDNGGSASLDFLELLDAQVSYRLLEYQGERIGINSGDMLAELQAGQFSLQAQAAADEIELALDGSLGPPQGDSERAEAPFSFELTAAGDRLSTEGQIVAAEDLRLSAQTQAQGDQLADIAQFFGSELEPVPAYQLSFSLAASPQAIQLENIEATLGSSFVYGEVTAQLDQPKPFLRAELGSSLLREQDLASLLPQDADEAPSEEPSQAPQLAFLEEVNADIRFVLGELQSEQLEQISGGLLTATLQDGLAEFNAEIEGEDLPLTLSGSLGPRQAPEAGDTTSLPFALDVGFADDQLSSAGQIHLQPQELNFSVDAQAKGNRLAEIAQRFGIAYDDAPAYALSLSAEKSADTYQVEELELSFGRSYLFGNAVVQMEGERPFVRAALNLPRLNQEDLGALLPEGEGGEEENIFSREPLNLSALEQFDGELQFALGRYEGTTGKVLARDMRVQTQLQNGVLDLRPIQLALAGGELDGHIQLDSSQEVPSLNAELSAESVNLNPLISAFYDLQESELDASGSMGANLELSTAGNSPHEMASQLEGGIDWAIYNGTVPAVVIEGIGLDLIEGAASWFGETVTTGVNCGVGKFVITEGEIHTETLLLSTVDSNVVGDGTIDLAEETIDYEIEARAKDFSLLSGESPIELSGDLNDINIGVASGDLLRNLGASALLALAGPALAVVPFIELGEEEGGECRELQQELQQIHQESQ